MTTPNDNHRAIDPLEIYGYAHADDELTAYYLHPDGEYRTERPAPVPGYAIPKPPMDAALCLTYYEAEADGQAVLC